jgi:hypothetical protein
MTSNESAFSALFLAQKRVIHKDPVKLFFFDTRAFQIFRVDKWISPQPLNNSYKFHPQPVDNPVDSDVDKM